MMICSKPIAGGQKVQIPIDMTINDPQIREIANCISARQDRGISNHKQEGTGVLVIYEK